MTAATDDRLITRHRLPGAPAPLPLTAHDLTPDTEHVGQVEPLGTGWMTVTVVIGLMAALIALGGMVLSFRAVSTEMIPAFGVRWAWLVPIVVDLTVFVFSGVDLVLARLDMSHPLARWTVYGATGGTVWLNYSVGGSAAGRVAHVLMPSIWVVFVELMRHVVRRQANLATGSHREPIPAARWLLSPWPTLKLWRRMVLWRVHSYPRALEQEKMRLGAVAAARELHGRFWRLRISPLTRLQINLGELGAHDLRPQAAGVPVASAPGYPPGGHPRNSAAASMPATVAATAAAAPTANGADLAANGHLSEPQHGAPPLLASPAHAPAPAASLAANGFAAPAQPAAAEAPVNGAAAVAAAHAATPRPQPPANGSETLPGVAAAGAAARAAAREAAPQQPPNPAVSQAIAQSQPTPPAVPAQRAHAAPPAVSFPQDGRRQEPPHDEYRASHPLPRRSMRESELLTAAREVERWRGQPNASRISRELGIGMALATSLANALRDEDGPLPDGER